MSDRRPALVLRVPSRTEFLAAIRDATRRMAAVAGFDDAQADQLALAVDEASTNVIEHAYRGAPGRTIEVRFQDGDGVLRVEVVDDGEPVDPRSVPLGAPVFLGTTLPLSAQPLQRLMAAQDTGGASRGAVRADFYWGTGSEAGTLAGRMRQQGRMWILWPRGEGPPRP